MDEKYDKKNIDSIYKYALEAKNRTILDIIDASSKASTGDKGGVGNLIQEDYFGIPRNSSPLPDFEEAELELKTFGFWHEDDKSRADQRLALSTIDFMEFESEVSFEDSHLYHKCKNMLFMAYLLKANKERVDSEIRYVRLYELEKIAKADLRQIKEDYYTITDKIRNGKASELSEGDTEFLGAARTGSKNSKFQHAPMKDMALPRRFALKQSYMSYLVREYLIPEKDFSKSANIKKHKKGISIPKKLTFEQWLDKKESRYIGKAAKKIAKYKEVAGVAGKINWSHKNAFSRLSLAMLGVKSNKDTYLRKTNTVIKSVRISSKGITMESNPFPNFDLADVVNEWEDSQMFAYLSERRFVLQIFVDKGKDYIYMGHVILKFTPEQLNKCVKDTWEDFRAKVKDGLAFHVKIDKNGNPKVYNNIQGKVDGQIGVIKLHVKDIIYDLNINHISGDTESAKNFIVDNTINDRFQWKIENKDTYGDILPNGDVIPKQSFWLNKDFILKFIQEKDPELLDYEK